MCSTDIEPTRLHVAQEAASQFVDRESTRSRVGIVAFSSFAAIIEPPTTDRQTLVDAIAGLNTGRRTAIGSAILASIDAIAENGPARRAERDRRAARDRAGAGRARGVRTGDHRRADRWREQLRPRPGRGRPAGRRTWAAGLYDRIRHRVRRPHQLRLSAQPDRPGAPGRRGPAAAASQFRRGIDEETLVAVADITAGAYYPAASADELAQVFDALPTSEITQNEVVEVSVAFVGLGALLCSAALILARAWRPLP